MIGSPLLNIALHRGDELEITIYYDAGNDWIVASAVPLEGIDTYGYGQSVREAVSALLLRVEQHLTPPTSRKD